MQHDGHAQAMKAAQADFGARALTYEHTGISTL